jgi:hypothetical protein
MCEDYYYEEKIITFLSHQHVRSWSEGKKKIIRLFRGRRNCDFLSNQTLFISCTIILITSFSFQGFIILQQPKKKKFKNYLCAIHSADI